MSMMDPSVAAALSAAGAGGAAGNNMSSEQVRQLQQQQQQSKQREEQKKEMLVQILTPEARERRKLEPLFFFPEKNNAFATTPLLPQFSFATSFSSSDILHTVSLILCVCALARAPALH